MTKRTISLLLALSLALGLGGCGTEAAEGLSASSEASYTKITNSDGDAFYLDDSVVDVAADEQADAKKITDAVQRYVATVLYGPYRAGSLWSMGISSRCQGLQQSWMRASATSLRNTRIRI